MGASFGVLMAMVAVMAFTIIIIGLINYKKRVDIYAEYKPYFGPFKAYMTLTFLFFGLFMFIMGIVTLFSNVEGKVGAFFTTSGGGLLALALGILLMYLTDKKAKEDGVTDAPKKLFLAGCATFWHVEWQIIKWSFLIWLIFRPRKKVYYVDD